MPQEPEQPVNPELEALMQVGIDSDEKLGAIETNTEGSLIKLDEIDSNTEAMLKATINLEEPLKQVADNTAQMVSVVAPQAEAVSKMAAFLSEMKGEKGSDGKDGERGSKFLGYFNSEDDLQGIKDAKPGDFAIVGEKGTLWYAV